MLVKVAIANLQGILAQILDEKGEEDMPDTHPVIVAGDVVQSAGSLVWPIFHLADEREVHTAECIAKARDEYRQAYLDIVMDLLQLTAFTVVIGAQEAQEVADRGTDDARNLLN